MGISKTEVNLRRLLASAPNQQNQAKLVHVFMFFHIYFYFLFLDSFLVGMKIFYCRIASESCFKKLCFLQYVATLRELLEQLAEERTAEGLPRLVSYKFRTFSVENWA